MPAGFLKTVAPQLAWLQSSGIQRPVDDANAGGVCAWLDEATGRPAFVYSEITGYFMTLCAQLARLDAPQTWRQRAVAAATWITDSAQHPSGGVLCRKYPVATPTDPFSFANGWTLLFDNAMVGFGLLKTYQLTSDQRWLDAALRIGRFVHERLFAGGTWSWGYDLKKDTALEPAERWSQHPGPFELKSSLFLEELGRLTGEALFHDLASDLLARAVAGQNRSGRFASRYPGGESTHLHPHFYTLEGLIYLAAHRQRPELWDAFFRGIDWAFTTCLVPEPPLQQWSADPDLVIKDLRCDVLAQGLRCYWLGKWLAPKQQSLAWEPEVDRLHQRLSAFALPSGGIAYGLDEYGKKGRHANAWCLFFWLEGHLFRHLNRAGEIPGRWFLT